MIAPRPHWELKRFFKTPTEEIQEGLNSGQAPEFTISVVINEGDRVKIISDVPVQQLVSNEVKAMSRAKSPNQNAVGGRRGPHDDFSFTDSFRKAERAPKTSNDMESMMKRGVSSLPAENIHSPVSSPFRGVKREKVKRPMSTGSGHVASSNAPSFFQRGGHGLRERTWSESPIVYDQIEAFQSKGSAIEQAILRAKDLTIARLTEEVDTLKRQAARAQQASSSKLREQDEKIRELKRQVQA